LTLSKQQYFVSDTTSQSAKRHDTLEIWGGLWPLCSPWLRLLDQVELRRY